MLVAEDRLDEGDGNLISHASQGLGFQLAGALRRMGKRTTALVRRPSESAAFAAIGLPHLVIDWEAAALDLPGNPDAYTCLFLTPEPNLSHNEPLSRFEFAGILRLARAALVKNSRLQVVAALPMASTSQQISEVQGLSSRVTVFLTPALFGYGDQGVFERALQLAQEAPESLKRSIPAIEATPLTFSGDLAALLLSALARKELFGRVLEVPATTSSLEEWRASFIKHFPLAGGLRHRLSGWFGRSGPALKAPSAARGARDAAIKTEPALESLPSLMTPLDRVFSQSAAVHARNPQLGLHFPPGRSL